MSSTTTVEVSIDTWQQLNMRKEPGESFDDVISALMTARVREAEPGNEPKYVDHYDAEDGQQCSNITPDRGECDNDADYVVVMEYNGNESEAPFCEKHANVDNRDEARRCPSPDGGGGKA